jgi:hypothetical protein
MVIDKVSIINPLPASYESQIRQIAGVTGHHPLQLVRRLLPGGPQPVRDLCDDPESWLRFYSKEFELP